MDSETFLSARYSETVMHEAEDGIEFCFAAGIMGDDANGMINPGGTALRCHLAKMATVTQRTR